MNIKPIIAALILFCPAGYGPLAAAPSESKREQIEAVRTRAIAGCTARDYARAAACYSEWSALAPGDPLVLKDLMWALWNGGRFAEAGAAARRVIELRPRDLTALSLLGRMPTAENRELVQKIYDRAGRPGNPGRAPDIIAFYRQLTALLPENRHIAEHLLSGLRHLHAYHDGSRLAAYLAGIYPREPRYWNWLGSMESLLGREDAAIRAFRNSIEIDPQQPRIRLQLAKKMIMRREFREALEELEPLKADEAGMSDVYPLRAMAQFWTMRFAESVPNWEAAVRLHPGKESYRLYEAQSLYFSGRQEEALRKLRKLVETTGNAKALVFLADATFMQGDGRGAETLLENAVVLLRPTDESTVLRMVDIYRANRQFEKLEVILDRFLEVCPDSLLALEAYAGLLEEKKEYAAALRLYGKIARLNPSSIVACDGLASCHQSLGNYRAALAHTRKLRSLDPTNLFYLSREAELLCILGEDNKARRLLMGWLDSNRNITVLPVLLYHGLAPRQDDPMLSYYYHHPLAVFEDHIRTLRRAGFTPVVASQVTDWYMKNIPLPPDPVMITFDDARLDSFLYADPVLKKYGFKATMFAPIVNIEGTRPPAYASWDTIRRYRDTGRWDIQSHGNSAHARIPARPDGRNGLFLINRLWLVNEDRFETMDEWRARVCGDYETARRCIAENLGKVPTAFAFPEGYYGQAGNCNSGEAAGVNFPAAQRYFDTFYTQDRYGMNTESRDPARLNRMTPGNNWTGQELLQHLERGNPFNKTYEQLIEIAVFNRKYREAYRWLDLMKRNNLPPGKLLAREAEIHDDAGDTDGALLLIQEALTIETTPELEQAKRRCERELAPEWTSLFEQRQDSANQQSWTINNRLGALRTGALRWSAVQRHGEYRQTGSPEEITVIDNAGGLGLNLRSGLYHEIYAEALWHTLSGSADDTATAVAGIDSSWTDEIDTRFEAGRSIYHTVPALRANVISTYGDIALTWRRDSTWKAGLREVYASLSDSNSRETASLEISRSLWRRGSLRAVYRFAYDNMNHLNPDYFSPQSLYINSLGIELVWSGRDYLANRRMEFYLAYLPSHTQEKNEGSAIEQNVRANLLIPFGERVSVRPGYSHYETPSYREDLFTADLAVRFH